MDRLSTSAPGAVVLNCLFLRPSWSHSPLYVFVTFETPTVGSGSPHSYFQIRDSH
jgi:hypothetical protein